MRKALVLMLASFLAIGCASVRHSMTAGAAANDAVVDRVEEGWAVLVLETGDTVIVPAGLLSSGAVEGDAVAIPAIPTQDAAFRKRAYDEATLILTGLMSSRP